MQPSLVRARIERYEWPSDLATARELLRTSDGTARLVGGGTDVALHPPSGATTLVDLSRLPMSYVERRGDVVAVGATTTLTELAESPLLADHADGIVPDMLAQVGSVALRNVATVGGHLARGRLSDVVPVLLVLDTQAVVFDGADRAIDLGDLYASPWDPSQILTEIRLPVVAGGRRAAFWRFTRAGFDFAVLNCAVSVGFDDGVVSTARVAVGETPALARRVTAVEDRLVGGRLDDDAIASASALASEVVPTRTDQRASAEYRTALVEVAVRRSLIEARGRRGEVAS